jgi:hypothetical protein
LKDVDEVAALGQRADDARKWPTVQLAVLQKWVAILAAPLQAAGRRLDVSKLDT